MGEVGRSFARGKWRLWPARQTVVVWEFLHAWWAATLAELAETAALWEYDLLGDQLPWRAWEDEDILRAELADWLVRHAPARLRAHGVPEELLHRIRLVGLTGPARWEDTHWPGHRY
ncbi:hypothetical protein [Streptomyces sp. NPDC003032]